MENAQRIIRAITDALRDAQAVTDCMRRSTAWSWKQNSTCDSPDIRSAKQLFQLEQFGDVLALCDDLITSAADRLAATLPTDRT